MLETIIWMAITVVLAITEAVTSNLVTVWFAVGAFGAVIAAAAGAEIWVQCSIFVLVSAIVLALTRPFVKKIAKKAPDATNADQAIGQVCLVTEEIINTPGKGAVLCLGKEWSARTIDGSTVEKGSRVKVCKIEGVKLIVEPLINTNI